MPQPSKNVEVECEVVHRTPKAILIRVATIDLGGSPSRDVWIPLSQVVEECPDDGFIVVTRFIAEQEDLE